MGRELKLEPAGKISMASRKADGYTLYLLLNEDDQETATRISFKPGNVYEVNLPDLSLTPAAGAQNGVTVEFEPMQLKVFLLDSSLT